MAVPTIPTLPKPPTGLPDDPWGQWVGANWGSLGFNPLDVATSLGRDLRDVIENRNDPGAWLAFGVATMRDVWNALPADLRSVMREKLEPLIVDGIEAATAFEGIGGSVADAFPVIGWVVGLFIEYGQAIYNLKKQIAADNERLSRFEQQRWQANTIRQYENPQQWVWVRAKVANYNEFRGGTTWRRQPCFDRSSGQTNLMFEPVAGAVDKGNCYPGTEYECGGALEPFVDPEACTPKKAGDQKNNCVRELAISSLFYPYWSPAYPAEPIMLTVAGPDPNQLLIERQIALLTTPDVNLRVNGRALRQIEARFSSWYMNQLRLTGGTNRLAVERVNEAGSLITTAAADRLTIDKQEQIPYAAAKAVKNRFYFDKSGIIHAYPGAPDADLTSWGVRALGGQGRGRDGGWLAVTLAQYNIIVSTVAAFFTARANMLRNTGIVHGLLLDNAIDDYESDVRSVMMFSSEQFKKNVPQLQSISTFGTPIPTIPAVVVKSRKRSSIAVPIAIAGGATAAYFFLPRLFR